MSPSQDTHRQARFLVTGGAGFIGSNLTHRLASEGHEVTILDSLARPGVEANLAWLTATHGARIRHLRADIRDARAVEDAVRDVAAVFHFAAQVAVTTSLSDPRADFDINIGGTFTLLEALRRRGGRVPVVFASTNKVYGDLSDVALELSKGAYQPVSAELRQHGIAEDRRLDFHTPYGCSKGAADQYVLDYARSFGLPAAVLRMSCIYGPRQRGTEDQGWVAHFLISAREGRPISLYGDGYQVRDVLEVSDCVDAYIACARNMPRVAGRAFNLGGGPANAVSLRQLIAEIELLLGKRVEVGFSDWRAGDQRYYVSDTRRAREALGLKPALGWKQGLRRLAAWLEAERGTHRQKLEAAE
jgi:CDP-paratose 2-epimerase